MPQIYAHDGGTQSLYIIYALPRVFRKATGKQRFRKTFLWASATAMPAHMTHPRKATSISSGKKEILRLLALDLMIHPTPF
jgi:hypothetical protein